MVPRSDRTNRWEARALRVFPFSILLTVILSALILWKGDFPSRAVALGLIAVAVLMLGRYVRFRRAQRQRQ